MGTSDIEASPAVAERSSVDIAKTQVGVGRQELHSALPPHDTYEGGHRWDPSATWTPEEEKRVVRKTDLRLLTWLCLMVSLVFALSGMGTYMGFSSLVFSLIVEISAML